jgi:hypothetical protein
VGQHRADAERSDTVRLCTGNLGDNVSGNCSNTAKGHVQQCICPRRRCRCHVYYNWKYYDSALTLTCMYRNHMWKHTSVASFTHSGPFVRRTMRDRIWLAL